MHYSPNKKEITGAPPHGPPSWPRPSQRPYEQQHNKIISNFTFPQHPQCDIKWMKTPFTYFHLVDCLVLLTLQPFFGGRKASISSSKLQEQVSNCIPNHTCFAILKLTKHQVKHAQHKTQTQQPTPYPYLDSPDDNWIAFPTE